MTELESYIIRYKNLMRRSFIGIIGSISVLILIFLVIQYHTSLNNIKTDKLNRLLGIANTVSVQLDGDIHDRITTIFSSKDDINSAESNGDYLTLYRILKDAQLINKLEAPIYTLIQTDDKKFEIIVTSDEVYYRHPYNSAPYRLANKFKEGGMLRPYIDEQGEWLSAFAPITNGWGHVVGVVMVDERFDTFVTLARNQLFRRLFILTFVLLVLVGSIYFWMRNIFSRMEDLNKVLENLVYERTNDLKVSNRKLQEFNQNLEATVAERTQALEIVNSKLRASNDSLQHFAHTASHDLKEPLRMVAGYTQLLNRRFIDPDNKNAKEFVGFILDGTKRMQILIDDILAFSKVDAEEDDFEVIELEEIIASVCQNLQPRIQEKQAVVKRENLPVVKGNYSQLIQLFQNLISNGIKFNKNQPIIEIRSEAIGDFWKIAISDNGIGIKEEHFKTIFKIFKRLHTRKEFSGTGIGLATCQKIVKKHGGKLSVHSIHGVGTTFYLTLPKPETNTSSSSNTSSNTNLNSNTNSNTNSSTSSNLEKV